MIQFPPLNLGSKDEIAKRISSPNFSQQQALLLLSDVIKNFDSYWYDSKRSEPEKGKFVRSAAKSTQLQKVLKSVNERILAPHDFRVPDFIFGGVSKRNNIQAVRRLLGGRERVLLKLDIKSFFEQISEKRVFYFFYKHCGCSVETATILSKLCCVPKGAKGSESKERVLARGFATSSRLAVWCNVKTFQHLVWKVGKRLRGHKPKIAIYIDDIGITASRIPKEKMEEIKKLAIQVLEYKDLNQPLPVHSGAGKTKITTLKEGAEHLGIKLGRTKLSLGAKPRSRFDRVKALANSTHQSSQDVDAKRRYKSYRIYKRQVEATPNKT